MQLDIILDHALYRKLVNALVQTDTMGGMDNIIAHMQLGQAVDFRALLAFPGAHLAAFARNAAVGNHGKARLRELGPGGQAAGCNQHPVFGQLLRRWGV